MIYKECYCKEHSHFSKPSYRMPLEFIIPVQTPVHPLYPAPFSVETFPFVGIPRHRGEYPSVLAALNPEYSFVLPGYMEAIPQAVRTFVISHLPGVSFLVRIRTSSSAGCSAAVPAAALLLWDVQTQNWRQRSSTWPHRASHSFPFPFSASCALFIIPYTNNVSASYFQKILVLRRQKDYNRHGWRISCKASPLQ